MIHLIHPVNPSVALDATDAAVDVDGVIEIDEVRQLVNLHPGNRPAALGAFTDQRQTRIVLEHLAVAIHTGRTGRDIGEPRFLDTGVAIAAIDSELAGVRAWRSTVERAGTRRACISE